MTMKKLLKITNIFWWLSYIGIVGLMFSLFVFSICEIINLLFGANIFSRERYVLWIEIISGVLMIFGILIPGIFEREFYKRNTFDIFLSQVRNIDVLNYYEHTSFLHILEYYIKAQDVCMDETLKNRLCDEQCNLYLKYYNNLWGNRILISLKELYSEKNIGQTCDDIIDQCFGYSVSSKGTTDIFLKLYTDKNRRIIEFGFFVLLVLSFFSGNTIDVSWILNALAIFLLSWDLCGAMNK